jgi:hypothetical protein
MNLRYSWYISTITKRASTCPVLSATTRRSQRGIVMPLAAIGMLTLLGFAALAIDVGYLFVVRNELQNAADTAALAGAGNLAPYTGSPLTPNWAAANTGATNAIALNQAANATLVNGQVQTGYWNITGSPTGLHSTSAGTDDLPAVMVTINKAAGSNGGAVNAFFAQVLGIPTFDVGARAAAVISSPGYTTSSLIPVAIPSCLYSSAYWNPATQTPTTPPTTFSLGSTIHYSGCGGVIEAEWTSLNTGANSTTKIRDLIDYATGTAINPDQPQIGIGSSIHIESGVKDTLYSTPVQTSINGCSAAGSGKCEYGLVPVVGQICTNCDRPVVGFACVHILSATGHPPNKGTIDIQLVAMGSVPQCNISNSGGVGPAYGVLQPPRLANYRGNNL